MHTAGKLAWTLWLLIAVVTVAVFVTAARTGPTPTPAHTGYPHVQLQADLQMTQLMSAPGASGPMSSGAVVDKPVAPLAGPRLRRGAGGSPARDRSDAGPRDSVRTLSSPLAG